MMPDAEIDELARDIAENGLLEPVGLLAIRFNPFGEREPLFRPLPQAVSVILERHLFRHFQEGLTLAVRILRLVFPVIHPDVMPQAYDLAMEQQAEQSHQFAARCREQLRPLHQLADNRLIISQSRENILASRALLIEADRILGQRGHLACRWAPQRSS